MRTVNIIPLVIVIPMLGLILSGCGAVFAAAVVGDAMHAAADEAVAMDDQHRARRMAYVRAWHLPADIKEAVLAGYVIDGMIEADVEAAVGRPQNTWTETSEDGAIRVWEYTDDVQLAYRDMDTLTVYFRRQLSEEYLRLIDENREAIATGEMTVETPPFEVFDVEMER